MSDFEKREAFIRHFLHCEPSEDLHEFARQARMADWVAQKLNPKEKGR